ncbi:hypothetical protein [Hymenobacter glacieicola]|uniref:Uncharacterized protein n=1 Tax=Hymenobacter glacieicola TaxID=1562124 RepID=A0ABQ1X5K1_9BACT|nr:hypothetical protein [Hymenobacter glacieicola]GGG57005.1 hypothetical protein GCM10011378_36410 [Hymenobacter glacieicola]
MRKFKGLSVAETAFYARLGLQLELLTLVDLSEWVDNVLLHEAALESFFVELYRHLRTGKEQVVSHLTRACQGERFSVRPALGWLQQLAAGAWPVGRVIQSVYRLRTLVESDREVGWIYGLAADYERAADGPAEAMQDVYRETEAFLACYHDYTFANRYQWLYLDAVLPQRWANLRH